MKSTVVASLIAFGIVACGSQGPEPAGKRNEVKIPPVQQDKLGPKGCDVSGGVGGGPDDCNMLCETMVCCVSCVEGVCMDYAQLCTCPGNACN